MHQLLALFSLLALMLFIAGRGLAQRTRASRAPLILFGRFVTDPAEKLRLMRRMGRAAMLVAPIAWLSLAALSYAPVVHKQVVRIALR